MIWVNSSGNQLVFAIAVHADGTAGRFVQFDDSKLGSGRAFCQAIMAIAGHVSRRMLEHYSRIRMEAKRTAVEAIAHPMFVGDGAQKWAQSPDSQKGAVPN